MKVRLRSNPHVEIETDVEELLDSFELKFRGRDNQPYLQLPNAQSGFVDVECLYVQNTPENREQYHPKNRELNNVLSIEIDKTGDTLIWHSARRLKDLETMPHLSGAWFAIDCALHKDYSPKLANRQLQQRLQAEREAREAQQRHIEILAQIEQLRIMAFDSGLTLALDYISSPDDEE